MSLGASMFFLMAVLPGPCCICHAPLGDLVCEDLETGVAEAYFICPNRITSITYAADSNGCDDEAEITAFGLDLTAPVPLPEELLQPVYFVEQEDDTGFLHEFDDKSEGGNTFWEHTITIQVNANNPDAGAIIRSMIGRQIAWLFKTKSGKWLFVGHLGGMKTTSSTGNSNQSWRNIISTGRLTQAPRYVSFSDGGVWADANLVPISVNPAGLINA